MTTAPTGVVLAAGAGSRYGMPKVLAEDGEWLRRATTALFDGGCADVLVVLGAATADIGRARAVYCDRWAEGLSRSVAAGLRAAEGDVLITLVDTPDVDGACVARLRNAGQARRSRYGGGSTRVGVLRATYRGVPGHPVFLAGRYRIAMAAQLEAAGPDTVDRGMWPHLAALGIRGADVECGDLATGRDVDRPVRS